jgi:2-dehydro-3-deoxyphosphogluconate aldolase/(4S)-4-hydroxy-2-oxoglutarate aldolase
MTASGPISAAAAAEARIRQSRVIAILRLDRADRIVAICRTLVSEGLAAVEITTDRPHAMASISSVREALGDRVLLGAGTVLDERTVDAAVSAGADFCVAPNLDRDVVAACRRREVLAIPGVFTPTEIANAGQLGLQLVKLFPCGGQAPEFLSALRGPFSAVGFVPTGGIGLSAVPAWLGAGAVAVGLGSALVRPDDALADLAHRARRLMGRMRQLEQAGADPAGRGRPAQNLRLAGTQEP